VVTCSIYATIRTRNDISTIAKTSKVDAFEKDVAAKVADGSLTYDFIAKESEAIDDCLDRSYGTVTHLKAVMDSEPLRKAIEDTQPKVVEFG
jgi:Zn-dependent oligopeptidase